MTENEATEVVKRLVGISPSERIITAVNMATLALEEIQQYRAIGTVEDITKVVRFLSVDDDGSIIDDIEEVKKYRLIGTVEECREAMEKQKSKTPNIWGDGYDDKGNMIHDMYDCPNCGQTYEIDYDDYKYCPECGQSIDRRYLE